MKKIFTFSIAIAVLIFSTAEILLSTGIAGKTGSPGETTCAASGCHSDAPANTGSGSITITSPDLTNWSYTPGTTYTINVTVAQANDSLFGFDFEALRVNDTVSAGKLVSINADTKLATKTVSGKVRSNIEHNGSGNNTNNLHTFTFQWTAPSADSGYVMFYAAGLAANNDVSTTGDSTYTTTQKVSSPMTVGVHELLPSSSFNVFPNPMHSNCDIRLASSAGNNKCDVLIYNLAGKLVQVNYGIALSGGEVKGFEVAKQLASGSYLMNVVVNGNINCKKIVINRD